jgi:hypothetical protein
MNQPMRMRAQLLLITMVFLSACGGAQKPKGGAAGATTPAGQRFPALGRVPARATYAGAAARLELMARLVRDLAGLAPTYSSPWSSSPGLAQEIDQRFRKSLGMSPIDPADLAQHGFAVDGSVAFFSTGVFPSFLIPVADRGRVEKLLEAATKQTTVIVAEHRGVHYTTWTGFADLLVGYTLLDNYLLVHFGNATLEKGKTAWLDEVLDAGGGIALEADMAWALEQSGARKEVLGLLRGPAFADALRALDDHLKTRTEAGCDALDKRAAGTVGRVAFAAALADGKLDSAARVEISREAVAALGEHMAAAPDARYHAARADAGFHVSAALDLDWLSQLGRDFGKDGCGFLWASLGELELWQLSDPFAATYGKRIFNSYHAALLGARVAGQSLDLQAVAWMGVADADGLRHILDLLVVGPFKSQRRVGGQEVTRLDLSLFQVAEPIELVQQGGSLRLATGRGMTERLLQGPGAQAAARELFSLRFRAEKFTDLQAPMTWIGGKLGVSDRGVAELAKLLGRFRWFGMDAALEDAGIRVAAGFELR